MAKARQGRSLAEDLYDALRADILLGRRLPGSRLHLKDIADEHGVSLSVVREAATRLASEDLVESEPQRGFHVRSLSLPDLRDLTWMRVHLESLALRTSIERGDLAWEADLVAAHHRLAATPMWVEGQAANPDWMAAHGAFHQALGAAAGSPILDRLRTQLYDAAEVYRYWSGTLTRGDLRTDVDREHRAIFEAALARDTDTAERLLTEHLEATARRLEAIITASSPGAEPAARSVTPR